MKSLNGVLVVVSVAIITGAGNASAQGVAEVSGLEEVVVTARKRVETIQDAPLTIQAFTEQQIEERGAQSLSDLAKFAPGLTFNQGSSRAASDFSIRGMTQISPVGDNRKDLVTTFVDGVPYIGNPSGIGTEDLAARRSHQGAAVGAVRACDLRRRDQPDHDDARQRVQGSRQRDGGDRRGVPAAGFGGGAAGRGQAGRTSARRGQHLRRLLQERVRRPARRIRPALRRGHAELHADRGHLDPAALQQPPRRGRSGGDDPDRSLYRAQLRPVPRLHDPFAGGVAGRHDAGAVAPRLLRRAEGAERSNRHQHDVAGVHAPAHSAEGASDRSRPRARGVVGGLVVRRRLYADSHRQYAGAEHRTGCGTSNWRPRTDTSSTSRTTRPRIRTNCA